MYSARAGVLFCGFFLQQLPGVTCGDLGAVDYIAIAVSLGLTVFILGFIGFFLWRGNKRTAMGPNNKEVGRDNPTVTGYKAGRVQELGMTSLPSTSKEAHITPYYNYVTYC